MCEWLTVALERRHGPVTVFCGQNDDALLPAGVGFLSLMRRTFCVVAAAYARAIGLRRASTTRTCSYSKINQLYSRHSVYEDFFMQCKIVLRPDGGVCRGGKAARDHGHRCWCAQVWRF